MTKRLVLASFLLLGAWAPVEKTVPDRVREYRYAFNKRLLPHLKKRHLSESPNVIELVVFKQEMFMELYAGDTKDSLKFIKKYPVTAASGVAGPKLAEGDLQVPEGVYAIDSLNPNSEYHLALHINYPNAADRKRALTEKRSNLGGDIMIHGEAESEGCVAIGNAAVEEIFVLASLTDLNNWKVVIAPVDMRQIEPKLIDPYAGISWLPQLYSEIKKELNVLPLPFEVEI